MSQMKRIELKKKSFLKKIFFLILRKFNLEVFDQENANFPISKLRVDENLSLINKKIFIFPFNHKKATRKVISLDIIFRQCTKVLVYQSSKGRVFSKKKDEYSFRSLNSILRSYKKIKNKISEVEVNFIIIDDNSEENIITKTKTLLEKFKVNYKVINLNIQEFENLIDPKVDKQSRHNLASIYKSVFFAKEYSKDLIYFVEDDYLHVDDFFEEIIFAYQKLATETQRDIFLCPSDYPYLYTDNNNATKVTLGNKRHWQIVDHSLGTFLTSKKILLQYWDNFQNYCNKRNEPFEAPLDEIYKTELAFSPIPTLAIHITNAKTIYGLSPFSNIEKIWNDNKLEN